MEAASAPSRAGRCAAAAATPQSCRPRAAAAVLLVMALLLLLLGARADIDTATLLSRLNATQGAACCCANGMLDNSTYAAVVSAVKRAALYTSEVPANILLPVCLVGPTMRALMRTLAQQYSVSMNITTPLQMPSTAQAALGYYYDNFGDTSYDARVWLGTEASLVNNVTLATTTSPVAAYAEGDLSNAMVLQDTTELPKEYSSSGTFNGFIVLLYNMNFVERNSFTLPNTWPELLSQASQVHGTDMDGDGQPDSALCLDLLPGCKAHAFLSAIYASMAQPDGKTQGIWFDRATFQPLFPNPAMAEALRMLRQLSQYGSTQTCGVINKDFRRGKCLFTLEWLTPFLATTYIYPDFRVAGRFNATRVPGSAFVWKGQNRHTDYDPSQPSSGLTSCSSSSTTCPYAVLETKASGGMQLVNRPSYASSISIASSISVGDNTNNTSAEDTSEIILKRVAHSYEQTWNFVLGPISSGTGTRQAAADIGLNYDDTVRMTPLGLEIADDNNTHAMEIGLPFNQLYRLALDIMAIKSLTSTDQDIAGIMATGLRDFAFVQSVFPYNHTLLLFLNATLGLTKKTTSSQGNGNGTDQNLTVVLTAGIVPGFFLLVALGLVLWLHLDRMKRGYRTFLGRSRPPGVGPGTTLVVTDIQSSTLLWEELSSDVMDIAIRLHHRCIRSVLTSNNGYESATEGDSFVCSFHNATHAVAFCSAAQVQLRDVEWPPELLRHPEARELVVRNIPHGTSQSNNRLLQAMATATRGGSRGPLNSHGLGTDLGPFLSAKVGDVPIQQPPGAKGEYEGNGDGGGGMSPRSPRSMAWLRSTWTRSSEALSNAVVPFSAEEGTVMPQKQSSGGRTILGFKTAATAISAVLDSQKGVSMVKRAAEAWGDADPAAAAEAAAEAEENARLQELLHTPAFVHVITSALSQVTSAIDYAAGGGGNSLSRLGPQQHAGPNGARDNHQAPDDTFTLLATALGWTWIQLLQAWYQETKLPAEDAVSSGGRFMGRSRSKQAYGSMSSDLLQKKTIAIFRGLRVRMGIHSGVLSTDELMLDKATQHLQYTGAPMVAVKAIADAASGGMVLMTAATFVTFQHETLQLRAQRERNEKNKNKTIKPTDSMMVITYAGRHNLGLKANIAAHVSLHVDAVMMPDELLMAPVAHAVTPLASRPPSAPPPKPEVLKAGWLASRRYTTADIPTLNLPDKDASHRPHRNGGDLDGDAWLDERASAASAASRPSGGPSRATSARYSRQQSTAKSPGRRRASIMNLLSRQASMETSSAVDRHSTGHGQQKGPEELRGHDLYMGVPLVLQARLGHLTPVRSKQAVLQGTLHAPAPGAAIVFMHAYGASLLLADLPGPARIALAMFRTCVLQQLSRAGGYLVETADGFVLAAFTHPAPAIAWALACSDDLNDQEWPEEILEHELGMELINFLPRISSSVGRASRRFSNTSNVEARSPEPDEALDLSGAATSLMSPHPENTGPNSATDTPRVISRAASVTFKQQPKHISNYKHLSKSGALRSGVTVVRGVRLRCGIDVGTIKPEVHPTTGRMVYRGRVMNRAARISIRAGPGQVLASAMAWQLSENHGAVLDNGLVAQELGSFELKGVVEPIEIVNCTRAGWAAA